MSAGESSITFVDAILLTFLVHLVRIDEIYIPEEKSQKGWDYKNFKLSIFFATLFYQNF